ncbi:MULTISPECIES: putative quinol monooxygenase [Gluconobacter]|uniref:Antibiotic biosynthesis monooxygenase n=1 Tax=Gluconobacter cadivus TaxID=2728101 RepID=A0ABR9YSK5_9PROT|nr:MULTISPECIES: putative quinol monooxygenase [Gluconobacter]MBF0887164.1 antibiotic biosynthesis monooxygenase [Gluconobacter cadivus]MBF0890595.1 antibiotic biosynthesis monooxygenase [Gluconobacter cadivus]MBN3866833.1 antibiotic biosynthesis monooxygenase [Gluconobacter kondonii]MBS1052668.1 antibiotic biosynthesis monooxygenase [Gluconobacter kondonii]MBS1056061.1 antibiotic biosynthesis monooxygenase [Gluconobacter kondonii]
MPKTLYATLKALPGQRETLRGLLTALAKDVRAEPGCERFKVYTLASDPDLFHVEETYRDDAAFAAHMATEHGKVFNQTITPLVEGGGSEVVFLDAVI